MKSPVEKSSDQESGSIGNAQAMNKTVSTKKRRSVSASTIEESLLPIKKRRSGSNEALRILEMQETKEKKAVETAGTKKLQPRRSLRISEMQEEKEAGMEVRNPTKKLQPRRSLRISEMQEEKKAVETTGIEVRNPTKKLQPRSNASLRIGNAQGSEIERKGKHDRNKGKGKEKEAVGMEVRNPSKKEVKDDDRRVTTIIKNWTALDWEYAYTSTSPLISKRVCMLEYKRDQKLRKLLWARDKSALEKEGLKVPTVDDKGRTFTVVLKQSRGYLTLTGEGWSELVQLNMVEMRSVFQIYTYREKGCLKFGIFFKIPILTGRKAV